MFNLLADTTLNTLIVTFGSVIVSLITVIGFKAKQKLQEIHILVDGRMSEALDHIVRLEAMVTPKQAVQAKNGS